MNKAECISEEAFVSNNLLFNEDVYKNLYPYSQANTGRQTVRRAWGKWLIVIAILFLVVAVIPNTLIYINSLGKDQRIAALLLPIIFDVVFFVAGILSVATWKRFNWGRMQPLINEDFARIKTGKPLIFWSGRKHLFHKLRKVEGPPQYAKDILDAPNEVMFHARICDDGISIGSSYKKVVSDYARDIDEIYESERYLGIVCKNYEGDIVFDKYVYRNPAGDRLNSEEIKKYIKARKKGKDVTLKDYVTNL